MKHILKFMALLAIALVTLCTPKEDNKDGENLLLLLALQGPWPGFVSVNYPGFPVAGRSASAFGKAEDKTILTVKYAGLERKTSFDVTYTFTSANGEIRLFGSVGTALKSRGDQDSYLRIIPSSITGIVAGANVAATAGKTKTITATPGTPKTICVDIHREADEPDNKVKFHYLIWDKACSALSVADRAGNQELDFETEIWESPRAISELAPMGRDEIYAGFALKDASFTTLNVGDPKSTAGSIRSVK